MKRYISIIVLAVIVFLTIPHYTFAASLYLTPSSGNIVVGQEFTVSVITDTEGLAINTAESNITFTSNTLELLEVKQGSTFLLPAPASPNKGISSAYFGGGMPNPGFNGKTGLLGTMKFRAKAIGKATVNITRGNVLLNDGAGSQAVTSLTGASFSITAGPVGNVMVSSITHPLQNSWSNSKDLELSWVLPTGAKEVSYIFDKNATTIPDDVIDATDKTQMSYPSLQDGEWYFHIKARSAGKNDPFSETTHYRVPIDTVAPLPFNIDLLAEPSAEDTSTTPTVTYNATDALSGVYRYDVYLDGKLSKELSIPPYAFTKTEEGHHVVKVIAYDKAGNGTASELPLVVTVPGRGPVTFDYVKKYLQLPLYGLILLNLLVFAGVGLLVRQSKKHNQMAAYQAIQIQALQSDIRNIIDFEVDLTRLKKHIDVRFMDMAKNQSLRVDELRIDISTKIEAEIAHNVDKLKTEISQKLNEARSFGKKQFDQIQNQIKDSIASELRAYQQPAYAKNNDMKVKTEVLRRLYDEFMNNKI